MPLNERDVVATVAEVRAAGQITPRALRRAVAARLGLDAKDEAVLIEKYTQCIEDAAAASSDAVSGEEKLAAAVAAPDSDDTSYDVRLGMTAAGEEKFDAIAIEASAAPYEDDSFASARPADERDVAEAMAAFSGDEDYFASASSDADTPARKSEGRIARAYSISEDEKECDNVLDKLSDLIADLESQLALQREAGDDEAAAATEAKIEEWTRRYDELYHQLRNLPRYDSASDSDDDASTEAEDDSLDARLEERLAKVAASIAEQEALLASQRAAGEKIAELEQTVRELKREQTACERRLGVSARTRSSGKRRGSCRYNFFLFLHARQTTLILKLWASHFSQIHSPSSSCRVARAQRAHVPRA